MKSITPAMDAHLSGVLTTICTCWKIIRDDGVVLGFTDHDRNLVIDDVVYTAASGFYRSAISNSADTGVDNLDVSGFLDDGSLDETELRNGAYDYAKVEVFAVNWSDLSQGIIRLRYGFFGEVMIVSSGFFKVELRGLTQLFSQTIVETYSPECRADLGDDRCKVPLVPPVRRSVHTYLAGDRIIVPIPPGISTTIPLLNPGFELRSAPHNWNQILGSVTNTNRLGQDIVDPYEAHEEYRFIAMTEDGIVRFTRPRNSVGTSSLIDYQGLTNILEGGEGATVRFSAFWALPDGTSIGGIHEATTGWITLTSVGEATHAIANQLPPAPTAPSPAPQPTLLVFTVEWEDAVPGLLHFVGYPLLDNALIPQASLLPSGLPTTAVYDWVLSPNARYTGSTVWISPYSGDWNLELYPGPNGTEFAYQEVDLAGLGDILDAIDDGTMRLGLHAQAGAATVGVNNFVSYRFYSETNSLLGTSTQDAKNTYGKGNWGPVNYSAPIPPGTRRVRVQLNTKNFTDNARARGVWDNISVRVFQESYENQGNYLSYGGVEFECISPGVSDVAMPSYSYTLGETTEDGSAVFQTVEPTHMFVTMITEVINHKQFKISSDINKINSWFEWGVIEMLNGDNFRKKMEIMSWDNDTKTITLALSLPYLPAVGDQLRLHTGCAKSRDVCHSKFNNMVNYRGEPDLPGTDQYFKIGAANSGSSSPPGKG